MQRIKSKYFHCSHLLELKSEVKKELKKVGYTNEHFDPYNIEGIPSTKVNESFFLGVDSASNFDQRRKNPTVELDLRLVLFFCNNQDQIYNRDYALFLGENVARFLSRPNKIYEYGFTLLFDQMQIDQYTTENNFIATAEIGLIGKVCLDTDRNLFKKIK